MVTVRPELWMCFASVKGLPRIAVVAIRWHFGSLSDALTPTGRGFAVATKHPEAFMGVKTRADLARFLDIPLQKLTMLAFTSGMELYIRRSVPKKSGGQRIVYAPRGDLKLIQRMIANELSASYDPPKCVQGFVKGQSVADNAIRHTHKRFVLTIDLKDFFPSISSGRVHELFLKYYGFTPELTDILTNLVCYQGCLPQGAPTSPIISNVVCFKMDRAFLSLASSFKLDYTRYADDLTFSTTSVFAARKVFDPSKAGLDGVNPKILEIISSNYFKVNERKLHVAWSGSRQLVNGIVVNEKCNMKRETYRQLRSLFHTWKTDGYEATVAKYLRGSPMYRSRLASDGQACSEEQFTRHMRGRLEYLTMVITVDGKTSGPIEKLWTMLYDQTGEAVPFVMPERYAIQINSCYDAEDGDTAIYSGTGFYVADKFITCAHCIPEISAGDDIEVELRFREGKRILKPEQFKVLRGFDLAYATFNDRRSPAISRLNLSYQPQAGEEVIAIGFPGGGSQYSVTARVLGFSPGHNTVRVDRAFIKGMSGGPVLNSRHELIGIVEKGSSEDSYSRDGEFILLSLVADIAPFNGWLNSEKYGQYGMACESRSSY